MKKLFLLTYLLLLLAPMGAMAQCCDEQFEKTFPEAVKNAPLVIEGEIISDMLFFGGEYSQDRSSSKIAVYKVLKGNISAKEIELIDMGHLIVRPSCNNGMGLGVFMLYPSDIKATPRNEIAPEHKFKYKFFAQVGCNAINYNAIEYGDYGYSRHGLYTLKDIEKKIYDVVKQQVGHDYIDIAPLPKKNFGGGNMAGAKSENGEKQSVNISSISPTTITAGTFDTLTIKGSGFTPEWQVGFRDADTYEEKFINIPDNHYIIRPNGGNDTLYKVLVPCVRLDKNVNGPAENTMIIAGSGKVALSKGTITRKSPEKLTIPYARITYALSDTASKIYPTRLGRNTTNGDFMFWLHPTLRGNHPARQLVSDAIEEWRCASEVNFTVACDSLSPVPIATKDYTSTISIANDTMPLLMALLQGKKAGTIHQFRLCKASNAAIVTEADIFFGAVNKMVTFFFII